ncbi:type II CAAX prenyl endopeptidase Rce1 family protein [Marinicrinis lubricantis]|uniref:Type II CAAX prenyl endopeptidase Rce1 family protein n=1 Tax=Marinicrinis lubricantis TaxID=2086470 RepID=A0ABW1IUG0_9BACL
MQNKNRVIFTEVIAAVVLVITAFIIIIMSGAEQLEEPQAEPVKLLTKNEAIETAAAHIQEKYGISTSELESSIVLQANIPLSAYLNKNDWMSEYDLKFADKYPVDYYEVELKQPSADRTYFIRVHSAKREVIGWNIYGAVEGNDIEEAKMQQMAESELTSLGYQPNDFWMTEKKPGLYVFRAKQPSIGEAAYQLTVQIEKGRVVMLHQGITPTDTFISWFQTEEEKRAGLSIIQLLMMAFLVVASLVTAIVYRKAAPWRRGILLSLIVLVLISINMYNSFPSIKAAYAEDPASGSLAMSGLLFQQGIYVILAFSLYLSFASGDGMFKTLGRRTWARWQEADYGRHTIRSMGRGYLYAVILISLQQIIFFIGDKQFQVWTYDDPAFYVENYVYPLLFPISAWVAAIMEEGTYRLFGIALFKKLFRLDILAILLPNLIWASGHIGYPFFPPYTRLVEVFIIGLIFSFIFLRYGLITAIFAHAALDCFLMGMSLLYSQEPYKGLVALLYIGSPAIVAIIIALLHRWLYPRQKHPEPLLPHDRLDGLKSS